MLAIPTEHLASASYFMSILKMTALWRIDRWLMLRRRKWTTANTFYKELSVMSLKMAWHNIWHVGLDTPLRTIPLNPCTTCRVTLSSALGNGRKASTDEERRKSAFPTSRTKLPLSTQDLLKPGINLNNDQFVRASIDYPEGLDYQDIRPNRVRTPKTHSPLRVEKDCPRSARQIDHTTR